MSKVYISARNLREGRPRSERLRRLGSGIQTGVSPIAGSTPAMVGHTHSNKDDLDRLFVDGQYVQVLIDQAEESGTTTKQKVKAYAGFADNAKRWDGKEADDYIDQPVKTSSSVAFSSLMVSGRRIYLGDVSHYIEIDANGNFHLSHGVWTESFVTAGGVGSGGGGGQGGGISTIFLGSERYDAAAGSTAIYLPAYPSQVTWANISGKPSWIGSTKPSYAFSEITGTAAATQIPSLDAGKITSGTFAAARIPTLAIGKISGLQTALDAKETTTHAAATYQPLATAINTGNIASQSVAYANNAGGLKSTATNAWDCNAPDRLVYQDYGSPGRNITHSPAGWVYGGLMTIGNTGSRGVNATLNLQLMWDVQHNTTNGGRLWFRGSDTSYGFAKTWNEIYHSGNLTSLSQLGQDAAHRLVTDAQIALWTKIANLFDTDSNGNVYVRNEKGFYSYSFITAGGIGSGGGGSTGALYTCVDVTAYNNSKVGRDSTHPAHPGDLLAYDGNKWHAVVAPATGVTSLGGATGAITVRGGQTANGSVNLSMSGTQLQAAIVGLGSLAYQSSVAAALGYTPYNAANIGSATVAYAGQVTAKNTGKALSAINAVASSADLWNDRGNSWVFENANNALVVTVGGTKNDRNANIQVGHSAAAYGQITGALYLNKLGGDVYIGSGLALHSGNYTAYCATAAQGAKADAAYGWGNHASAGYASASALSSHVGNTSNPHAVTKAQVGLGNVDNTADANKSVARAHGLTSVQVTASFDLNTALSGGGVTGNYGATNYWVNGPSGLGYGSVAQIQASTDRGDQLALQLAWGIEHNSTSSTKRLWFRSSNNLGWQADWKEIYHSGNSNKSDVAWACSTLTASGNAIVSGNVGIGTTSPTEKLELFGGALKIRSRGVSGTEYVTIATSDVSCHINGYDSGGWMNFYIQSNGVTKWTLNGRDGTFVATGNVTAGSDRRWKENISYSVGGIDIIKKLRPATWDWKEGHGKGKGAGLIAQDVMAVLPYAVQGSGKDGYTLNYNVFHAFEISALQQHENEIDRLRRKVAELEKRLNIN